MNNIIHLCVPILPTINVVRSVEKRELTFLTQLRVAEKLATFDVSVFFHYVMSICLYRVFLQESRAFLQDSTFVDAVQ